MGLLARIGVNAVLCVHVAYGDHKTNEQRQETLLKAAAYLWL
jgi:hypothetical protein